MKRFGNAMAHSSAMSGGFESGPLLRAYDWKSLVESAVVVDVRLIPFKRSFLTRC